MIKKHILIINLSLNKYPMKVGYVKCAHDSKIIHPIVAGEGDSDFQIMNCKGSKK